MLNRSNKVTAKGKSTHKEPLSKPYENFINSLQSEATKEIYRARLGLFLAAIKEKNYARLAKVKPLVLQEKLIAFINDLRSKNASYSTMRGYISAVRHFCVMNDITLNWSKIAKFAGENKRIVEDRIYTREEIQKMLDKCDERKRVMLLILMTGMRIGAIAELKLKHLTETKEKGIYKLTVYPGTSSKYTTFCTPECGRAIDSYLAYRKLKGETLTPESPLVREQFNEDDADKPRHVATKTIVQVLEKVLYDSGLREKTHDGKRRDVMRFHAFRKYVNTAMIKANVKPVVKEMLLGHRVGLEDSYYRPSEDEMLVEYLKAVELLTISNEKQLKHEVEKLQLEKMEIEGIKKNYIDLKITSEKTIAELKETVNWLVQAEKERHGLEPHAEELERMDKQTVPPKP